MIQGIGMALLTIGLLGMPFACSAADNANESGELTQKPTATATAPSSNPEKPQCSCTATDAALSDAKAAANRDMIVAYGRAYADFNEYKAQLRKATIELY